MTGSVALTGGTGFVGGHVLRRLVAEGWCVRALVRQADAALPDGVTPIVGTLEDVACLERLVDGADAVVHCAGPVRAAAAAAFDAANAGGTGRLAAVAASGRPRFILMSSLAAREPGLSAYAASKLAAEHALARRGGGLQWTVLRPPAVYGPGDRGTLGFFRQFERGIAPLPGDGAGRVSLIYAEDLARAVPALLAAPGGGGVHEIRDGRAAGYTWREIAAAAARATGRPVACVPVPRWAMLAAAAANVAWRRVFGGVPALTPGKARELCHADWVCRDNPVAAATGWAPTVTLDDGFARTVAWYRDMGWI